MSGFRYERTKPDAEGGVTGTGEIRELPIQAIYRAVGYFGSPLDGIPFDEKRGVIPNREGQVIDDAGQQLHGIYATGWIKRGPIGLIGHTKSDAAETIRHLVEDATEADGTALRTATEPDPAAVLDFLAAREVPVVEWTDWELLDAYEIALGTAVGRERIKVVPRDEMTAIALGEQA